MYGPLKQRSVVSRRRCRAAQPLIGARNRAKPGAIADRNSLLARFLDRVRGYGVARPWCALVLTGLLACGRGTASSSERPAAGGHGSTSGTASVDAAAAPADADPVSERNAMAGCVWDAAAQAACDARGRPFRYGPEPSVYCSGVAPDPADEAARQQRIRESPCQCFDEVAVSEQQTMCSMVPSMPPG